MEDASRNEIPKNAGSNWSIESTKLPSLQYICPEYSERTQSDELHRETFLTMSLPCWRLCQKAWRDPDSAKRPLIPIMATGSAPRMRDWGSWPASDGAVAIVSFQGPDVLRTCVSFVEICSCQ